MDVQKQGKAWFLAQIKPNSARIAKTNLDRQGFDTFLPMEEIVHRRKGRFVTSRSPMFPGYIFVAFDVENAQWRAVNSTYGITRLVSFGDAPAPVPAGIMSELTNRCDSSGFLLPPQKLEPGDRVTVTSGPFTDLVAEIEKAAPDRRVWVLLDVMGGKTRVEVGTDQIKMT